MIKIMECKFGSHLYGTCTPNSDLDIKGVFLPYKTDILLGKVPKSITENTKQNNDSKNTKDDVDKEFYSLHYFLKLACEGETVALDMLHVNQECLVESSYIWEFLYKNRSRFYTKSLKSFVGYARRQASKYGIKGSRLNSAKNVYDYLLSKDEDKKLSFYWGELPTPDHVYKNDINPISNLREYQIVGKKFQETTKIGYIRPILVSFIQEYGHRAKKAANNEGIDWKAVSHALRAAFQTKSILTEGDIIFPLKEASYLKSVKNGELDFLTEVSPKLEFLMDEIEELTKISSLPEKVNRKFWDDWLISVIEEVYYGSCK